MKQSFYPQSLGYVKSGDTWELPTNTRRVERHAEYKRWYAFFKGLDKKSILSLKEACDGVNYRSRGGYPPSKKHLGIVTRLFRVRKQRQDKDRGKYTWYYRIPALPLKALMVVYFELDMPCKETQRDHSSMVTLPCRGYKPIPSGQTDVSEALKAIKTIQYGFDSIQPAFSLKNPALMGLSREQWAWEFNVQETDELNYTRVFADKLWHVDVPGSGRLQVMPVVLEYQVNGIKGKMQAPADEIYKKSDKLLTLFETI